MAKLVDAVFLPRQDATNVENSTFGSLGGDTEE